ncbi:1361_t:CDS:2 [Gigaspora margarita]|uniref:1361_t:CDS:1 n=1 Tax=Gigaspora margarita TaxID=4874 RepID=A0ABN7WFF8_GIGMA|nr:1361_t:CDS:2 [Gigaspora margarita]
MNLSMQTLAADGLQFISPNSTILSIAPNQDDKGIEWLQIVKRHFGDFCNKLVNDIENLVKVFKDKSTVSVPTSSPLQKEEIITFLNEAKMLDVLNWWLNAANMDELCAHDSKIIHRYEGTKALDGLTKGIVVPSRNGKNFASNIKL